MSTNVQVLNQTSATPTPCVPILKDPTAAAVEMDIRAMGELAQVNTCFTGFADVLGWSKLLVYSLLSEKQCPIFLSCVSLENIAFRIHSWLISV